MCFHCGGGGAWVWSLVGEIGSPMPCNRAKTPQNSCLYLANAYWQPTLCHTPLCEFWIQWRITCMELLASQNSDCSKEGHALGCDGREGFEEDDSGGDEVREIMETGLNALSISSVQSVMSDSLRPHGLQHASITNSRSLLEPMSIESVMPSNLLILCHPLLLPPSIFPSIRVFSNESVLHIRWPKYWSFSFTSVLPI